MTDASFDNTRHVRQGVLILPYSSAWCGGVDPRFVPGHARVCKAGELIDEFPRTWSGRPRHIKGRYLYGGPLKVHFGHVMVDTIIRLWAFDPKRHDGVVFPRLNRPNKTVPHWVSEISVFFGGERDPVPDWVFEIFALFGVERHHAIFVNQPTVFQEIEFAPPGSSLATGPSDWYLEYLKTLPLTLDVETPKDILISRRHIIDQGTFMGESFFSEHLLENGFVDFQPENHDIRTQMATIANAERVVFVEGSAIYSIELLAKSSAQIYMLPRRRGCVGLFQPHVAARAPFSVLGPLNSIRRLDNLAGENKPNSPSYLLRPELTFAAMVEAGLLPNHTFSLAAFETAEQTDAARYFKSDRARSAAQLEEIRAARGREG